MRYLCLIAISLIFASYFQQAREVDIANILVQTGFRIDPFVEGLTKPVSIIVNDQDEILVAETGDTTGDNKIIKISKNGKKSILISGSAFGDDLPLTTLAHYDGQTYVVHGGIVSVIENNRLRPIITNLPKQTRSVAVNNGFIYIAIGTVTNAGVVGLDNAWINDEESRGLHDTSCYDILLTNQVFESESNLDSISAKTSAYSAYGTVLPNNATIKGSTKCNGAILRARLDGRDMQVYAWGFGALRSLEVGPDGALYATMRGFQNTGSRPIKDAWDCLYRVQPGEWYGWPDFACDVPVTDQRFQHDPKPQFLLAGHPTETPPKPVMKFDVSNCIDGFAFTPESWGRPSEIVIVQSGKTFLADSTKPGQGKIQRFNLQSGEPSDLVRNVEEGRANNNTQGLEYPTDIAFSNQGVVYISDRGKINNDGEIKSQSGLIWRVTPPGVEMEADTYNDIMVILSLSLYVLVISLLLFRTINRYKRLAVKKNPIRPRSRW